MPYYSNYVNGLEHVKRYYQLRKEIIKAKSKIYYAKHREKFKEYQRTKYNQRNTIKEIKPREEPVLSEEITLSFD